MTSNFWITADKIHNGKEWLNADYCIEYDSVAKIILQVLPKKSIPKGTPISKVDGWITPGFINTHCHLELAHLHKRIPKHTGLIDFITNIIKERGKDSTTFIKNKIKESYTNMYNNGIQAIGDICNTTDTLSAKQEQELLFYNFIEAIGSNPQNATTAFENISKTYLAFVQKGNTDHYNAIVPHAPYSISTPLLEKIIAFGKDKTLSIHHEESPEEKKWMLNGSGLFPKFYEWLGMATGTIISPKKSSTQWLLEKAPAMQQLLLVHNTAMDETDIQLLTSSKTKYSICFCPNANLYIEKRLPHIPFFLNKGINICIGTDSLASNDCMSIYEELRTIKKHFPKISWEELIKWGTYNGAKALNMESKVGTLSPNKKCGLIAIKPHSNTVKRIL